MVVHPRTHELSESIIHSFSNPAINGHTLCPKANCLRLEVTLLGKYRKWVVETNLNPPLMLKMWTKNCQHSKWHWTLTSTALSMSLNTERCFLLSVLALCLLQSVASAFSLSHSESQLSNSKSWRDTKTFCIHDQWKSICKIKIKKIILSK